MSLITCGIDWAWDHHDIALVDADGRLVAKRRIPDSVTGCVTGFDELLQLFADADAGEDEHDPIPVAIETPRGLLVAVLRATTHTLRQRPGGPRLYPTGVATQPSPAQPPAGRYTVGPAGCWRPGTASDQPDSRTAIVAMGNRSS